MDLLCRSRQLPISKSISRRFGYAHSFRVASRRWSFALAMACYSVALARLVSASAYLAHVQSPPKHSTFMVESILFRFLSLLRLSNLSFWLACLSSCAEHVLLRFCKYSPLRCSSARCMFGPGGPTVIVLPAFCVQAASSLSWREHGPWKDAFWVFVSIRALSNVAAAINLRLRNAACLTNHRSVRVAIFI